MSSGRKSQNQIKLSNVTAKYSDQNDTLVIFDAYVLKQLLSSTHVGDLHTRDSDDGNHFLFGKGS